MTNSEVFADRLIKLREKLGVSQQELADCLGVTRQSLSLYEKAARTINIDLLVKIANYFKVSTDYLLGLSDVQSVNEDIKVVCKITGLSEKAVQRLSDMQICDFNMPYKRTDIIEYIILSGRFRNLLNVLCETCVFACAENLTNTTQYEASPDGKTVNLNQLSRNDLIEFGSQKALKIFSIIVDKVIKEVKNNGKNREEEE